MWMIGLRSLLKFAYLYVSFLLALPCQLLPLAFVALLLVFTSWLPLEPAASLASPGQELRLAGDELRQTCRSNEVMAWLKLEEFQEAVDLCTAAQPHVVRTVPVVKCVQHKSVGRMEGTEVSFA